MIQKLYELREVAETTGLTLGTVRQYVCSGVIPALRLGRKRVVRADVLEKICTEGLRTKKTTKGMTDDNPQRSPMQSASFGTASLLDPTCRVEDIRALIERSSEGAA